jgi:hypothetical protein
MDVLRNWTAKRAGGRITIYHSTGKVPHVDTILVKGGKVVACDRNGVEYELQI